MPSENYTDKVSVNINTSTLSQIDLLVDNGYYSNRSDFINQAIRDALGRQQSTIEHIVQRQERRVQQPNGWFIGVSGFTAREVERLHAQGERTAVTGYGVLHIDSPAIEQRKAGSYHHWNIPTSVADENAGCHIVLPYALGVEFAQLRDLACGTVTAGVDETGRYASALQCEFAEPQHTVICHKAYESFPVAERFHTVAEQLIHRYAEIARDDGQQGYVGR